ncbi:MAG: GtrA family protein [Treponema phagedenis]|uniref:GtrA family protein n=1 Tax=Treponema phagedenis TaxID=162 RepID=UPI0031341A3B
MKIIDVTLIKFLIVGVVNTAAGAGVMFLLYNLLHCSYWVSSACNYVVGGVASFFLNKYFTFSNQQKSLKQIFIFIVNLALCYVIAYIAAKWLIYALFAHVPENAKDNLAMLCGMCLYTALNYLAQRYIVFKE